MNTVKKNVKGYIQVSENILGARIENVIAFTSDGGGRFPELKTRKGDVLLFNTQTEYMPGILSCFLLNNSDDSNPYRLGYEIPDNAEYIGRLCLTICRY